MVGRAAPLVAVVACLAVACAERFPPGWVYVTRVEPTAATVAWTGDAGGRATCRAAGGAPVTASGEAQRRGLVTARLESLAAGTRYACRVSAPYGRVLHRVGFRTAPATPDGSILFAVVGDSGHGGRVAKAIARHIRAAHPAFLLHVGDLAYTHGTVAEMAGCFFPPYRHTLRRVPFYPTPGNHDLFARSIYRDLFAPVADGGPAGAYRYHFTWGAAALVSLSAPEAAAGAPGLAGDFGAGPAWRIVFLHEPLYTAGWKRVEPGLRATFGPVVEAAGVDLVLAGHQHFYERSEPSCEFSSTARVSHVTSGGGSGPQFLDPIRRHPNFPFAASVPHFLRVRVSPDRLDVRAVGADGHTIDRLRRQRGVDPGCRAQGWPRQQRRT